MWAFLRRMVSFWESLVRCDSVLEESAERQLLLVKCWRIFKTGAKTSVNDDLSVQVSAAAPRRVMFVSSRASLSDASSSLESSWGIQS